MNTGMLKCYKFISRSGVAVAPFVQTELLNGHDFACDEKLVAMSLNKWAEGFLSCPGDCTRRWTLSQVVQDTVFLAQPTDLGTACAS